MDPSPQRVRTRGAARPRNLVAGCLSVLVILAVCGLIGRFLRAEGPDAVDRPPPVSADAPLPAP
jgi:hypothetical protein